MNKGIGLVLGAIIFFVVIVVAGTALFVFVLPATGVTGFGVAPTTITCAVEDTTIRGSGWDELAGSASNVNMVLFRNDDVEFVTETNGTGLTSLSTSAPTDFSGYIMAGNDNFESSTDRGTEYYYRKEPFNYNCVGEHIIPKVTTYAEGTPTWTFYDDGASEATANLTLSSAEFDQTSEIKFAVGDNAVLGNPQFDRPLAMCFNASDLTLFDEIKPSDHDGTIATPEFLKGYNIGWCWKLKTGAVRDGGNYRVGLVYDVAAGKDPGSTDNSHIFLLDYTYHINDVGTWVGNWEDQSNLAADGDVGMAVVGNEKIVSFM